MLEIYFGNYQGEDYIYDPDTYFDNVYEDRWLESDQAGQMIKDIDGSDLIGPNLVQSQYLGPIPPSRLSGGVKTLILIANDPSHVFNASACGDNCSGWLIRLGRERDVLVRLGYLMDFGEGSLEIKISNSGNIVHSDREMVHEVIERGYLREGLD